MINSSKNTFVPPNKIFNAEKEHYLRENFRTTPNDVLAKNIGLAKDHMRKIMRNLCLKRTPQEIQALISNGLSNRDEQKKAQKVRKIEGGSRNCNNRIKYHKTRWIEKNGPIPNNMVLVYENGDYENYNDLILIKKISFNSFIKKRDIRLRKEQRQKKTAVTVYQAEERRRRRERQEQMEEELKKNYKQKSFTEAVCEQLENEKVPVRLDHKTLIFVRKDKCYQDEHGNWHKKA